MKTVQIFMGRMQPVHIGHAKIINSMDNPVVVIVKGAKTGKDKKKNPLSVEYQIELVKKIAPFAKIVTAPTGYLPDIIDWLRKDEMDVDLIYAGEDRIAGYEKQIDSANSKLSAEDKYNVKFKETERVTSATTVRNAIRAKDEAAFKKNMPKELWGEFETMVDLLGECLDIDILSFQEWLDEDESGAVSTPAVTTTTNVEIKDTPLKPVIRRKKKKTTSETKMEA